MTGSRVERTGRLKQVTRDSPKADSIELEMILIQRRQKEVEYEQVNKKADDEISSS
jgi:hypothetical protein